MTAMTVAGRIQQTRHFDSDAYNSQENQENEGVVLHRPDGTLIYERDGTPDATGDVDTVGADATTMLAAFATATMTPTKVSLYCP